MPLFRPRDSANLWLCHEKLLDGRQKSGILWNRRTPKPTPWEEEEPSTEQRMEYTDLGLDLGEREEQVTFHALALVLTTTDKACREAKM